MTWFLTMDWETIEGKVKPAPIVRISLRMNVAHEMGGKDAEAAFAAPNHIANSVSLVTPRPMLVTLVAPSLYIVGSRPLFMQYVVVQLAAM